MSALAEVLLDCGMQVSACDRGDSPRLDALRRRGVTVWTGEDAGDHLCDARSVVYTAAAGRDHPELVEARTRRLLTVPRSLVLARFTRAIPSVCVAGSHGKSTVTALLAHLLTCAGHAPGYVVGSVIRGVNHGGFLGGGGVMVLETDEFDRTIERVRPHLGIITNIEPEHLDVYGTVGALTAAFGRFARRARIGIVAWDEGAGGPVGSLRAVGTLRCGTGDDADVRCQVNGWEGPRPRVEIRLPDGAEIQATLAVPGMHNACNAALAAAGAWRLGAPPAAIGEGLATYPGLERRFEVLGTAGGAILITDYAHHPTEIRATLATARALGNPIIAVFQPHLYSRTAILFNDFARSFADADRVVLTPIYAARERQVPGVTSEALCGAVNAAGVRAEAVGSWEALRDLLCPLLGPALTVVFLTAGDLDAFARCFIAEIGSG
ncbi:MAG: Mur ligase family protein [Candidatus Eisenbacteria bacterium]|nr:Mur ligase family protein [Candidatus Eisenbacteria bacterium]